MDGTTSNNRPRPIHLLDDDDEYWYAEDEDLTQNTLEEVSDEQLRGNQDLHQQQSVREEAAATSEENAPPSESVLSNDAPLSIEELAIKYPAIVKHNIFQFAGDDNNGRPVIGFSMSRLPPRTEINHDELLQFMKQLLERYVENDYTIVYFHYGISSKNKPSLKWLKQLYQVELDRKYKKNLKALLVVHPSNFVKIVMKVFSPLISSKFGKKVTFINRLNELKGYLHLDQLDIPPEVMKHDHELSVKSQAVSNSIFHHNVKI